MSPQEFKDARQNFGLAKKDFGILLGYTGELRNIYMTVKRYEMGTREISPMIERRVRILVWFKANYGYLPEMDNGWRDPAGMPEEFSEAE